MVSTLASPKPQGLFPELFHFGPEIPPFDVNWHTRHLNERTLQVHVDTSDVTSLQRSYGPRNLILCQLLAVSGAEEIDHLHKQIRCEATFLFGRGAADPCRHALFELPILGNRHG